MQSCSSTTCSTSAGLPSLRPTKAATIPLEASRSAKPQMELLALPKADQKLDRGSLLHTLQLCPLPHLRQARPSHLLNRTKASSRRSSNRNLTSRRKSQRTRSQTLTTSQPQSWAQLLHCSEERHLRRTRNLSTMLSADTAHRTNSPPPKKSGLCVKTRLARTPSTSNSTSSAALRNKNPNS